MPYRLRACWIGALGLAIASGCALAPYRYGNFHGSDEPRGPKEAVIEKGEPNKRLDRIAYALGAPARLFAMDRKVNKHELSPETEAKVKEYLEKNDLTDVYVYVNHYDPAGQWRRLRDNHLVAPVFRYTIGALSFAGYTILPPRIFGGDHYNPYTNSLYLNSDVPAVVLAEAAYAKDLHGRKLPGPYALIADLPLLSLWHDSVAVDDVLRYARTENDWEVEEQAYRVLYPRVGQQSTSLGAPFVSVWWGGPVLGLGGAAVGHVAGRAVASRREHERHDLAPLADSLAQVPRGVGTVPTGAGTLSQGVGTPPQGVAALPQGVAALPQGVGSLPREPAQVQQASFADPGDRAVQPAMFNESARGDPRHSAESHDAGPGEAEPALLRPDPAAIERLPRP